MTSQKPAGIKAGRVKSVWNCAIGILEVSCVTTVVIDDVGVVVVVKSSLEYPFVGRLWFKYKMVPVVFPAVVVSVDI